MEILLDYIIRFETALTLVVTVFGGILARGQARISKKATQRFALRQKETLLSMQLLFASIKLNKATAVSVKEIGGNGEVEKALSDCEDAEKEYENFTREILSTKISKI